MRVERYNEWSINEGLFDSFKNAMSRVVGGAVSKLDDIIKKYEDNEESYWSHYIGAQNMLAKAKSMYYGVSDPLERSKHEEERRRTQKLVDTVEKSRTDIADSLLKQANLIIAGNEWLRYYWTLKTAKADGKIAQNAHGEVKKLSDEKVIATLFAEIEKKIGESKKRELEFKKKYAGTTSWETTVSTSAAVKDEPAAATAGVVPPDQKTPDEKTPEEVKPVHTAPSDEKIHKWMSDVCEEVPEKGRANLVIDLTRIYQELVKRGVSFTEAKFNMSNDAIEIYDEKMKSDKLNKTLTVGEINDIIKKRYDK